MQIVKSDDHDTTDFEKGVWFACKHALKTIVCLGALGGRMDHTLAALSDSQKIQAKDKDLHLLLYG